MQKPETFNVDDGLAPGAKANATFVILGAQLSVDDEQDGSDTLARNSDLAGISSSMKQMEDRFNKKYQYPYVFLNEQEFSEEFKSRVTELTDAKVEFGLIPHDDWYQPKSINETRATAAREKMVQESVIYGVCRKHFPWLDLWHSTHRLDLGIATCVASILAYVPPADDVRLTTNADISSSGATNCSPNINTTGVSSFTISLYEYEATIPTLWNAVKQFIHANPELVEPENALAFLSDDGGETYNRCHCKYLPPTSPFSPYNIPPNDVSVSVWSNFEIGDLDFWRGEAYRKFFDFLDEQGGFYYEDTDTIPSNIARNSQRMLTANAGATQKTTLAMQPTAAMSTCVHICTARRDLVWPTMTKEHVLPLGSLENTLNEWFRQRGVQSEPTVVAVLSPTMSEVGMQGIFRHACMVDTYMRQSWTHIP
ncbi:glycosyltransferase family protein [Salix suchowensis]|nr:glycosyltransferase family protein [Salix suchowensis]